jgi:hypothetical protein
MHKAQVRLEADESSIEIEIGIEIEIDSVLYLGSTRYRYRFRFRFRFQMGARRVQLAPWHWQRVASVAQQQEACPEIVVIANEKVGLCAMIKAKHRLSSRTLTSVGLQPMVPVT